MLTLDEVWSRLGNVGTLTFVARSGVQSGWNGSGAGTVVIETPAKDVILFAESGVWTPEVGPTTRFRNVFRWTRANARLRLEHLRFGPDHPVFLFDLEPGGEHDWRSVSPHQCREDCYSAVMTLFPATIKLAWEIAGPRKQERIEYTYS